MGSNVKAFFEALGERIDAAWRARNYDQAQFPDVAAQALRETPPSAHVEHTAILDWLFETTTLPLQVEPERNFGDPPLQLAVHPLFYIEALFWADGTTAIHDHAFSGAFHVLAGSSIQSLYRFDQERHVNDELQLGRLSWQSSELLAKGDTKPIIAGRAMLHALFHLDRPSVTIVVRTHQQRLPQYRYKAPGLALQSSPQTTLFLLRLRALSLLRRTDPARYAHQRRTLMATCPLDEALDLLTDLTLCGEPHDVLEESVGLVHKRDPGAAALFEASLQHELRTRQLVGLRGTVRDVEHRFFLALLLNVPSRQALLDTVARRFADDAPWTRVTEWLSVLADRMGIVVTPEHLQGLSVALQTGKVPAIAAELRAHDVLAPLFD